MVSSMDLSLKLKDQRPVNRIFLGRKPKQPPQHVPGGYEVGHFGTFFEVATLSPHVMLAEKTCFRSC